jgi:GntR family transcriptional regulator, transcriptional repressor for pyruvate dehydrogenase complex
MAADSAARALGLAPLPSVDQKSAILDALAGFIERAGLRPGEQLPSERELMEALRVGRSTIREVIRHWLALGIVEVRKGSGTFLKRPVGAKTVYLPLSIFAERDALLQTLEVRRGLETEATALAALRATAGDIEIIEQRLVEMERVHIAEGTAGPQDLAFHLSIYEASHNPLFGQLLSQMREAFTSFWAKPFDRSDFASRSFPLHRPLFEAIARHDPGTARQHTLAILAIVEEDINRMSHE